jgi:hypothetical protein
LAAEPADEAQSYDENCCMTCLLLAILSKSTEELLTMAKSGKTTNPYPYVTYADAKTHEA